MGYGVLITSQSAPFAIRSALDANRELACAAYHLRMSAYHLLIIARGLRVSLYGS